MKRIDFDLVEALGVREGWGREQGCRVRLALLEQLTTRPDALLIRVSLAGLERADVSFCREAVIEAAQSERRRRGFVLVDAVGVDMLENWDAAALLRSQPLLAFGETWGRGSPYRLLGPQPRAGLRAMFDYALSVPVARTHEAAIALGLKIPNASNKLSQLWQDGYVLRRERSAESGGVEYEYLGFL